MNKRLPQNRPRRDLPEELIAPHPARLAPDSPGYAAIVRAHGAAVTAGEAGYLDPSTSLFVMTATYLWERGDCCESGCRHCPFLKR